MVLAQTLHTSRKNKPFTTQKRTARNTRKAEQHSSEEKHAPDTGKQNNPSKKTDNPEKGKSLSHVQEETSLPHKEEKQELRLPLSCETFRREPATS